jgi:hypothetical protein
MPDSAGHSHAAAGSAAGAPSSGDRRLACSPVTELGLGLATGIVVGNRHRGGPQIEPPQRCEIRLGANQAGRHERTRDPESEAHGKNEPGHPNSAQLTSPDRADATQSFGGPARRLSSLMLFGRRRAGGKVLMMALSSRARRVALI